VQRSRASRGSRRPCSQSRSHSQFTLRSARLTLGVSNNSMSTLSRIIATLRCARLDSFSSRWAYTANVKITSSMICLWASRQDSSICCRAHPANTLSFSGDCGPCEEDLLRIFEATISQEAAKTAAMQARTAAKPARGPDIWPARWC